MHNSEVTLEYEEYRHQDNTEQAWSCSSTEARICPTSGFLQILQSFLSVHTQCLYLKSEHTGGKNSVQGPSSIVKQPIA
jgi:hypothetical protein